MKIVPKWFEKKGDELLGVKKPDPIQQRSRYEQAAANRAYKPTVEDIERFNEFMTKMRIVYAPRTISTASKLLNLDMYELR